MNEACCKGRLSKLTFRAAGKGRTAFLTYQLPMAKGVWTEGSGQVEIMGCCCVGSLGTRVLAVWLVESDLSFPSDVVSLSGIKAGWENDLWDFLAN